MRSFRALPVLVMAFLAIGRAQDAPQTVKTIEDVKVGMARNLVLSGLAKKYDLRKTDTPEWWFVFGKDPDKFERAEIWFDINDKVSDVYVYMYPPMTGEAVKLMERLFLLLNDRAKIDPSAQKILQDPALGSSRWASEIANLKHLNLPIDLYYVRHDKLKSMKIDFTIEKEHFHIEVRKVESFPETVEVQRYFDRFTEMQGK